MLKKSFLNALILLAAIYFTSCQSVSKGKVSPFRLNSAYYQSWVMSENERGTDIILRLDGVRKGIEFDSIVFRGIELPVFTSAEKDVIILKSILPIGQSRIRIESRVTGGPDQLIYRIKGKRKSYLLKNLERKETRYYPARTQEK